MDMANGKRALTALVLVLLWLQSVGLAGSTGGAPKPAASLRQIGDVWCIAFSPDGTSVAAGADERDRGSEVLVWDVHSGQQMLSLEQSVFIQAVAFSHRGGTLACGYDDGVRLFDARTGALSATLEVNDRGKPATPEANGVKDISFSPDDGLLAVACADGMVTVWDVKAAVPRGRLFVSEDLAFAVAFSPDGKTLAASGGYDGRVRLFDTGTWRAGRTFVGHGETVDALAFSPDGKWLATGSWDDTAKIWDVATGKAVCTLRGHTFNVWTVAFSPDSTLLATTGQEVIVWAVPTGSRRTLLPDEDSVAAVFSPDGRMLATAEGATCHLWDVRQITGQTESRRSLVPEARQQKSRTAREDDVREAVFRYQFLHDQSGLQPRAEVLFISVDAKDPSDQFLRRFSGNRPPVKKKSQSRYSRRRAGFSAIQVEDKHTRKPGLIYSVDSITWLSDSAVLVKGGYYAGGRAAAGHEYRVVRERGKWVVKKDTITWIS